MVRALLLLQGFVTRDRRKDSAKEADQHLVELEQAYAENLPEGLGEDGAGSASEAGGFVLEDIFDDQSQFQAMLQTLRVLLGSGQPQEAQQLTDAIVRMFSKRGTDRRVPAAHIVQVYDVCSTPAQSSSHSCRWTKTPHVQKESWLATWVADDLCLTDF